ncbi:zona pellucida protein AX 1 [Trichomycterus rosablanca]|uniref:zona pellucida protein AX 1 n=1 Tax=Trichomycterus rosablanca TaxID=2290929 RepID=UPI002F351A88
MVFYTPVEKPMKKVEVQNAGYGLSATPARLVLRSPYNMPELYTETVSRVQMKVLKVNTYFKWAWSITLLDISAACPTGGLYFTDNIITWYMPRYITPLMTQRTYVIIELYMGIEGKRLSQAQMNAKGYNLTMTETQIIMKLPFGGPDGYYKSHALDYKYHITYSIEPMLEMLWLSGQSAYTRYKVHYPIISPPAPRMPHVTDNTVEGSEMFEIMVGPFLKDVELMNITFPTGVMTPEVANDRGFNIKQHTFYNGSKAFSISVPFSDPVVQKSNIKHETTHTLPLIFGLIILPEHTPFPHPAVVTAKGKDVVLPTVNARCDDKNFYITVAHEELGKAFDMMVGGRDLGPDLYQEYHVKENSTHLSMTVPFLARDAAFEFAFQSSLRSRIDLLLHDQGSNWHIKNFSMACNFPMSMTECFSNGSITALVVKLESGPNMVPSKLTLKDPTCKPTFMNDRFAYFNFDANSCGTTRTFSEDVMTYENEIVMSDETNTSDEQNYQVVVSCSYKLNDAKVLDFSATPQQMEIMAEPGFGELEVRMRLAKNSSYKSFYVKEDYPIVQFLKQPLFFEVELLQSTDPRIELVLDNCWASDAGQTISWDVIVDGCINPSDRYQTTFYQVLADERVLYPSHVKRFRVKMFTFFKDNEPVQDPIFIHCEALICDIYDADSVCMKQCPLPKNGSTNRVDRRIRHDQLDRMQVSSGKILFSSV